MGCPTADRAAVAPAVAESVIPIDGRTLGVLNDNNYPFSSGRNPGQPDDNEFILIRLDAPLPIDSRVGPEEDEDVGQDGNSHGHH